MRVHILHRQKGGTNLDKQPAQVSVSTPPTLHVRLLAATALRRGLCMRVPPLVA